MSHVFIWQMIKIDKELDKNWLLQIKRYKIDNIYKLMVDTLIETLKLTL